MIAPLLLALSVAHAAAAPAPSGYVVKVDGPTVYIDLGETAGAKVGRGFEVYAEGEELKHPVTGASLGKIQNVLVAGKLTQVQAQFSIGTVDKPEGLKAGQRARLAAEAPAPAPAPVQAPSAPGMANQRGPRVKGPNFDFAIKGLAIGDFTGSGKPELALAHNDGVQLFDYPPATSKPKAEWRVPGSAPRVLSLEAADLDGDGRAEMFVSLYSDALGRVETAVLRLSTSGLTQTAELSYVVRSLQNREGKVFLAGQRLMDDTTFPFSGIYPVVFKDGKYALGSEKVEHKRADWLWSFTHAELDGRPAMLYLTTNDSLRVQFDSGYYKTRESYGQTPVRLRWPAKDAGKLLEFHPRMRSALVGGKSAIYAVRNLSMLGSLSEPFGLFNGGELRRLAWNGVSLEDEWKSELGGFSTAFELVPSPAEPKDVVIAVTGTAGKSAVWIYDP